MFQRDTTDRFLLGADSLVVPDRLHAQGPGTRPVERGYPVASRIQVPERALTRLHSARQTKKSANHVTDTSLRATAVMLPSSSERRSAPQSSAAYRMTSQRPGLGFRRRRHGSNTILASLTITAPNCTFTRRFVTRALTKTGNGGHFPAAQARRQQKIFSMAYGVTAWMPPPGNALPIGGAFIGSSRHRRSPPFHSPRCRPSTWLVWG